MEVGAVFTQVLESHEQTIFDTQFAFSAALGFFLGISHGQGFDHQSKYSSTYPCQTTEGTIFQSAQPVVF